MSNSLRMPLQTGVQFQGKLPKLAADSQGRASEGSYQTRQKGPAVQAKLTESAGIAKRQSPAKRQKTTAAKVGHADEMAVFL